MKRLVLGFALLVSFAGLMTIFTSTGTQPPATALKQTGILPPDRALALLAERLKKLPAYSSEAQSIVRQIKKIRRSSNTDYAPQENPGLLLEALVQLKTTKNGQTYAPGYKRSESIKAKNRLKRAGTPLPWVVRGPGNVSGRVRAIVLDPTDPERIWYAASIGGGIWKTTDAGLTWGPISEELTSLATTCLAMAASNPNVMYAGTGMGYGRVVELSGSGIWKTTDRGETWNQLASTANGQLFGAINRIVVDPNNENIVLACSNDSFSHFGPKGGTRISGIFRSTDGGQSWQKVFDPDAVFGTQTDNRVQQIIADPTNFNRLYATVNEVGVIRSLDAGQTWTVSANNFALPSDVGVPTGNGFGLAGISVRTELAISPTNPNVLYAAVERPRGIADLFMTRNAGQSWTLVNDSGNDPNWFNNSGVSGANGYTAGWFDNTITVHPYDPNIVFVGGVNLYRINVNPNNATRVTTPIAWWLPNVGLPFIHADHHWLMAIPVNRANGTFRLLDGNDGGIGYSADGGNNWRQLTGMITTQFYGVDKKPGENAYIGGMQDNGTWRSGTNPNAGSQWQFQIGGDGFEAVWHGKDPNLLLGGSQFGNLRRSTDGGVTWTPVTGSRNGFAPFITKIANSKTDPDLVFTIDQTGVFRSDDFGASWTHTPITNNWLGYRPYDNVEISNADPRRIWISSRLDVDPPAGVRGGVHVSSDSGLTFSDISSRFPADLTEPSGIATHPSEPDTAFIMFSLPNHPKILKTTDFGQTWLDISGFQARTATSANGFPNVAVFSLLVMPHDPNILWAGTEIGLFVSENGGQSWAFADNGLPQVSIFQISIADGQIMLATQGLGIITVDLPELATYQPPQVTLTPRLRNLATHPSGLVFLDVDLRSAYERTQIILDGQVFAEIGINEPGESRRLWFPVDQGGTRQVSIDSIKDGEIYRSPTKSVVARPMPVRTTYGQDFENSAASGDFLEANFVFAAPSGFSDQALHSPHPYPNASEITATLAMPFLVPEQGATISYDDVVLVEPGAGSGTFGDPNFFDFVIVEGSRDGTTWLPLADGYDSRANQGWLTAFNNASNGTSSLFVSHQIDVLQTFSPGEEIFIRFRLSADAGANGWGWAIDNLAIFAGQGQTASEVKRLVYPWVSNSDQFESILVANNLGDNEARVELTALREPGLGDRTQSLTIPPQGFLRAQASELFPNLGNGEGYTVMLETRSPKVIGRWVTNNLTSATGRSPSQGVAIDLPDLSQVTDEHAGRDILFGYVPVTDGLTSAPVIVNLGDRPTDVVLNFYAEDGSLVLRDDTSLRGLAPNRPFARVANQLIPQAAMDLYMVASSADQPLSGVTFVFNSQGETAIGNVTSLRSSTSAAELLYPWISNSDQFESILVANNTGDAPARVTLAARRAEGDAVVVEKTIPAHGFLKAFASELFPALGQGAGYTVKLDADVAHVHGRWVTNNLFAASGRSPAQGLAVDLANQDSGNRSVGSAMVFGYLPITGDLFSAPVLVNVGNQPIDVRMEFYDRQGQLILTDTESLRGLPPYRPFATLANDLLSGQTEDITMIARTSSGTLTGVAYIFNSGSEPAIGNATILPVEVTDP